MMMRRAFLDSAAIGLIAVATAKLGVAISLAAETFEVNYSDEEWRKRLTADVFPDRYRNEPMLVSSAAAN